MNFWDQDAEMKVAFDLFVVESRELLQSMEDGLLGLEHETEPVESINAIFRAAHTIKGSSGLFGLDVVVRFTHVVENVLDRLRDGKIGVAPELISVMLPCRDHISALVEAIAANQAADTPALNSAGEALLARLQSFQDPAKTRLTEAPDAVAERSGGGMVEAGDWHLSLRFGVDSFRNGMDPLSFIRYLGTLGDVVSLTTLAEQIPVASEMDAESCYLGFEIDLKSAASKEAIEGVFEFVREDSRIHILPPNSLINDYIELIRSLPEDDLHLGEILVKSGVLTQRELDEGLNLQKTHADDAAGTQPIGEILVQQHVVQQPLVDAALDKQKQGKESKARENQSIRVDAARLDQLIELVGELVIAGAGAALRASKSGDPALIESISEVMGMVEGVRDSALQLRMVPIGATFSRFQRVVRDVSAELGKDIQLVITGGDTEVDKSVVEKIGDPLMHLVRNSMDHGIESGPVRAANGKPVKGTLSLNAYHESGNIIIEVSDDGGGLNRERILAKGVERGLVPPGAILTDKEIFALIFEPGFSTADQVSNLSGRGVGMDVVRRNVTALRGSIDVESTAGAGSIFRIRLPLTLAIIDGFLVEVGHSGFVIPLQRVIECVEIPADSQARDYMDLRGEVLPFIRLRGLFEVEGAPPRRENVVVVEHAGVKTGLVVDRLLGEFQTVIKPMGTLFGHVRGIGGFTILGSGEVALILDISSLIRHYADLEKASHV
ncbi:MAG: chemotaxis protein CheA [Pseudomonadota bacterium]|nr:chemotaxis protein CheA [Pseudomonadota bacterium]